MFRASTNHQAGEPSREQYDEIKGLDKKDKYSKTSVKGPLKNRQNKDLNNNW